MHLSQAQIITHSDEPFVTRQSTLFPLHDAPASVTTTTPSASSRQAALVSLQRGSARGGKYAKKFISAQQSGFKNKSLKIDLEIKQQVLFRLNMGWKEQRGDEEGPRILFEICCVCLDGQRQFDDTASRHYVNVRGVPFMFITFIWCV